jgi:hypothetical protein
MCKNAGKDFKMPSTMKSTNTQQDSYLILDIPPLILGYPPCGNHLNQQEGERLSHIWLVSNLGFKTQSLSSLVFGAFQEIQNLIRFDAPASVPLPRPAMPNRCGF